MNITVNLPPKKNSILDLKNLAPALVSSLPAIYYAFQSITSPGAITFTKEVLSERHIYWVKEL